MAIVHEWLTIPGGSENVVLQLLEMFPQAELFTSVYDPAPWPAQITERTVHASFLSRLPGASRHYPKLLPLMNRAFRAFDLTGFDLVISSNHACAKNVSVPQGSLHICYCHTPMRYAWDEDFLHGEVSASTRKMIAPLLSYLRRQDLKGAESVDLFVANSAHTASRIERYYGRSSEIVNPPVDVEHFLALKPDRESFFLTFGRVVPYKRVDLAVSACAELNMPLKVAGDGRAMEAVRAIAGDASQIEFLGRVSDFQRDELLRGARALIFPGEEDFGIVPVEAQAAGVPVIAYGVGGATETVLEGVTGVLFDQQSIEGLAGAIERFEKLDLDEQTIRVHTEKFAPERFREEMACVIMRAAAEFDEKRNGSVRASAA